MSTGGRRGLFSLKVHCHHTNIRTRDRLQTQSSVSWFVSGAFLILPFFLVSGFAFRLLFVFHMVSHCLGRHLSVSGCNIWQSVQCTHNYDILVFDCTEGVHLCSVDLLWFEALHSLPQDFLQAFRLPVTEFVTIKEFPVKSS